ncbi:MAG: NAD(P)-dependent oxidoreductase [Bacteroidaceae bacterium]|nr:NAD(P)-dependent oxidoreductase [Bacteroidaceae bacterium]
MKILVTGASGFIGSFLCEEGLKRNMETWAGMREHSSRRWLTDKRLKFATLDMTDAERLKGQLADYKKEVGRWDVIIHAGGATKCLKREDFDLHNYICTKNLVNTLAELNMLPTQFLYVSSLSVLGPIREEQNADGTYNDMLTTDAPQPNTAYGESKVKSEIFLKSAHKKEEGFSYTIFRPTGVYGPREKDYFMMAKSIKQHIDFGAGFKRQVLTFVYVRDLVNAIFSAIGKAEVANGKSYLVSDGQNYSSRAFSDLIQKELGIKQVFHFTAPLGLLRVICAVAEFFSHLTHKASTLNGDKYRIMRQRNWQCDITPLKEDLGYVPEWPLERGVKECIAWYKENHWI